MAMKKLSHGMPDNLVIVNYTTKELAKFLNTNNYNPHSDLDGAYGIHLWGEYAYPVSKEGCANLVAKGANKLAFSTVLDIMAAHNKKDQWIDYKKGELLPEGEYRVYYRQRGRTYVARPAWFDRAVGMFTLFPSNRKHSIKDVVKYCKPPKDPVLI